MNAKFNSAQRVLLKHIAGDIKTNPEQYLNSGNWLDRYYDDHELCWKKYKYELSSRISKMKKEAVLTDCDKSILQEDEEHLEAVQKYDIECRVPLLHRLSYALEDLWLDYCSSKILSKKNARAILIIAWLLTDPEANEHNLNITEFAKLQWEKNDSSLPSRKGLVNDVFWGRKPASFGSRFCSYTEGDYLNLLFIAWETLFSSTIEGAIIVREMHRAKTGHNRLLGLEEIGSASIKQACALNQEPNTPTEPEITPAETKPIETDPKPKTVKEPSKERGRPKKYTDDKLDSMQKLYDDEYKRCKDSKAAWNKVANIFSVNTGDAARIACMNHRKKLK